MLNVMSYSISESGTLFVYFTNNLIVTTNIIGNLIKKNVFVGNNYHVEEYTSSKFQKLFPDIFLHVNFIRNYHFEHPFIVDDSSLYIDDVFLSSPVDSF
jgi:hypothetical protein